MMRFLGIAVLVLGALVSSEAQQNTSADWAEYGGNLAGQRYSTSATIKPSNVAGLQVAWTFHTHVFHKPPARADERASFEDTPILFDNKLYIVTPFDAILAVDALTGKQVWSFDPQVDRDRKLYSVTSRGLALWKTSRKRAGTCGTARVIVATLDKRLIARDALTGVACPKFGADGTVDLTKGIDIANPSSYSFTSPPIVVGDMIVLGSSIGDNVSTFEASGAVRGFDTITGKQKWSWEPLRWTTGQHAHSSGSGNAWSLLSADAEHDLVFIPTGSASVDFYGGTRLGDNRDADSLVALRASTGERVWGFQLVHHDIWDYDTPSQPMLFTFRGSIPAVAITTKTSMVYVFNRLTGEPLYPIEERAVPASTLHGEQAWPTQPFSTLPSLTPLSFTAADVHLHHAEDQKFCLTELKRLDNLGLFTPPSRKGSVIYPGSLGGANWGSSAFDPLSSVLYTRVSSLPFLVRELKPLPGGQSFSARIERRIREHAPEWAGGDPPLLANEFKTPDSGSEQRDLYSQQGTPYTLARQALVTPSGVPCGPQPFGSIVATNLNTGKQLWSVPHGEMTKGELGSIGDGGVIATAGGVLFGASTNDAKLRAYDMSNGKELWSWQLPAVANATPMSYTAGGRQFVVIASGGGFLSPSKSDEVIAFSLPVSTGTTGKHDARNPARKSR